MLRRMSRELRIGLLGCGTVGGGVLHLLQAQAEALEAHVGARLDVARVLVRDASKSRPVSADRLTTDAAAVLEDASIDLFVEVVGGETAAKGFIEQALRAGKPVVTANKLVLAKHGASLFGLAREKGVDLAFEAAIGGGIPIVRTLRDAMVSDRVVSLMGILNGTSNYVLTRMLDDGIDMEEAVRAAQDMGFAEADPSADLGGHDAAHKLGLLARLAFGVDLPVPTIEGIDSIEAVDHRFAARFGYCVKPLAIGRVSERGVELRVHPALVPNRSVLANVNGELNAVWFEGEGLGPCLVYGRGAGALPTAVSVVADIADVARALVAGVGGLSTTGTRAAQATNDAQAVPPGDVETRYYVRFTVDDQPGVMATLAGALGARGVSIEQLVQDGRPSEGPATVVLITHRAREADLRAALDDVSAPEVRVKPPCVLRIEDPSGGGA